MKKSQKFKKKSLMSHNFSEVPKAEIQRSVFDRTHGYKTTFDGGYLIPFTLTNVCRATHSMSTLHYLPDLLHRLLRLWIISILMYSIFLFL